MKKLSLILALFGIMFTACHKGSDNEENGSNHTYQIGDLVEKSGAKGVVFYVDESVVKIVSVDESTQKWSTKFENTYARDFYNGANNMAEIKSIADWETIYLAFKWCADHGEGWYLPACAELKNLYNQHEIINSTLSANGLTTLDELSYWSSTEVKDNSAYDIYYSDWCHEVTLSKHSNSSVRAVFAFTK